MLAGAGIRKGLAHGATDDLGYAAVENPVSVHDFHATMLYLLGVDAAKLAEKYQGLDVRLTGPQGGTVVHDILAEIDRASRSAGVPHIDRAGPCRPSS